MTTSTRVRMKLQKDSGSILYEDSEDGVIFHIEAMRDVAPAPRAREDASAGATGLEQAGATTDLVKSFLRQHLLKNGESSHSVMPLMREGSAGPLLDAVTALHLRVSAGGAEGCGGTGAAISDIYKTLGVLVSMLQQREKAREIVGGGHG